MKFVVLGAGIAGLTTALTLQEHGHSLRLIARECGPGTCSYQSGAWWIDEFENSEPYKRRTAFSFDKFHNDALNRTSGAVQLKTGHVYFPHVKAQAPWFASVLPRCRFLASHELPEHLGAQSGIEVTTVLINPHKYLRYLLDKFEANGGVFEVREVSHIDEICNYDVLVNCTGLGSQTLGGVEDSSVYPVRGQTTLIQAAEGSPDYSFVSYRETGQPRSIIPRGDGVYVLNGTYEVNKYSLEPDEKTAARIWEHCHQLNPELLDTCTVISEQAGLRPYRQAGPRIELELRLGRTVIHNYGHGGDGMMLSWGCAKEVCALVLSLHAKL